MKKLTFHLIGGGLIIAFCLLQSCSQEEIIPESTIIPENETTRRKEVNVAPNDSSCRISLIGDKDGCGIGLVDGDVWSPATSGINSWPISFQNNDPDFTDIYPADKYGVINYQHNFCVRGTEILSAKFVFSTLGIQDGDNQVYGSDTDILFFIDDEEVTAAFDNVDQFDKYEGEWMSSVATIELAVPQHLLHHLQDGEVLVRWEILQLSSCEGCTDAFAIDYSELILNY